VNSFNRYVRQVFFGALSLVLVIAGLFLLTGHETWARGFALGGIASLANLVIMAGDVRRQGKATAGRLVRPAYGRYALRMTMTAAALIYAALNPELSLWAVVPALFAAQFTMTCGELVRNRKQENI
jgi:hypothetical protein